MGIVNAEDSHPPGVDLSETLQGPVGWLYEK